MASYEQRGAANPRKRIGLSEDLQGRFISFHPRPARNMLLPQRKIYYCILSVTAPYVTLHRLLQ